MAGELDQQEKQILAKSQKDFALWIEHFAVGRAIPFQRLLKPRMAKNDWPRAWQKQQVRDIHGTWISLEDAMQQHDISPLVLPFAQWAITTYGLECLATRYHIETGQLLEPDWADHMREKTWIAYLDFRAALDGARVYHYKVAPCRSSLSAQKKGTLAPLSIRFTIFKRDGYRCRLCGITARFGARLEVDHITARSKGGNNDPSNLWTLCFECNRGKRDNQL